MKLLFSVLMVFQGKANFRNLSRWYCRAFDFATFNYILLTQMLYSADDQEKIGAVDASFLRKSGKNTDDLGNFYNGGAGRSERGLEVSLVSIVDMKSNMAYALDAKQTQDVKGKSRADLYASQIVSVAQKMLSMNIRYVACDAWYYKIKFIDPVVLSGLHIVCKLRSDANLQWLFVGPAPKRRGRPRCYAGKVSFYNNLSKFAFHGIDDECEIYSAVVNCKVLKRNIKLIMLRKNCDCKQGSALLFSTNTELDTKAVVRYYKARFQIEFLFPDAKQHMGLMDCQSTKQSAINTHINASLTTLNLIKLEDRRIKKTCGPTVISIASHKRRKFNKYLASLIFSKLGFCINDQKYHSIFE